MLLYALYRTEQDLGWLLSEELLSPAAGRAVSDGVRALCAELAPHYRCRRGTRCASVVGMCRRPVGLLRRTL